MKVVDLMNYLSMFVGETDMKDVPITEEMEEIGKESGKKESEKKDATRL